MDENLIKEMTAALERVCSLTLPHYQKPEFYNSLPRGLFQVFADAGVTALTVDEKFGGSSSGPRVFAAALETIAKFDVGPAIFLSVHSMVEGIIGRFGNERQKADILPRLSSGESLGAFALTEPNAGSDASSLSCQAVEDAGGYRLKGTKCYITSAGFADIYLVFAKSGGETSQGISAFLVPASTPGLTFGPPEKKMGAELSPIASLFFDDALIPKENLLGTEGEGYRIALSGLAGGRINIAACANGLSSAAIELAIKHLNEREQFGSPLIQFQGLQFMLAEMYMKFEAARSLTKRAIEEIEAGLGNGEVKLSSSMAKCFATDAAMAITTDAVQLLGGAGYIKEYTVERLMRDAKMLQIVEGTNQIQRIIIARELSK